ncbi:hypothetical protein Rhe02_18180 [Rhizocola hellebori]|uniref:Caspase domain-containing protein n=1 Tax=Rhizocola hellebori TaxID=1392758 RepID=A0A8J3Q4W3_9ACTN|nr:caspase family protein [Rhizocola hellebori]GIH03751.1 hypothetical protein Rhe02_18180 [Rhizocola hellebori]
MPPDDMLPAPPLPRGRRLALVIATSTYQSRAYEDLLAPAGDADTMARLLSDPDICGFEVTRVVDRPWAEIQLAINQIFNAGDPDDLVLVYVSGHGEKDHNGRLHLIATDTDPATMPATSVTGRWLLDRAEEAAARRQIIVIDTCFSGAYDVKGALLADGLAADLEADLFPSAGRVILTASRGTEYAYQERTATNAVLGSVFTSALAEGLQTGHADLSGTGLITVSDAYRYAFAVVARSKHRQTPQLHISGGEGADIVLSRNPAGLRPSAPDLRDILVALDSSSSALRRGAVDDLGALLRDPNPALAAAARNRLERLVAEDQALGPAARAILDGARERTEPSFVGRARRTPRTRHTPPGADVPWTPPEDRAPQQPDVEDDPIPQLFDFSEEEFSSLGPVEDPLGVFGSRRVVPLEDVPSNLVARYLFPTERYRGEWRRHWWDPFAAAAVSGWAIGRAQRPLDPAFLRLPSQVLGYPTATVLMWTLIGIGVLAAHRALSWPVRRLVLTNKRVMTVRGLLWRRVSAVALYDMVDIRFSQTPWGAILGFGKLTFVTGRLRAYAAHHLPNPNELYLRVIEERFEPNAVEARLGRSDDDDDGY